MVIEEKIVKIEKAVPRQVTLPDGYYRGTWGGYKVRVNYNKQAYDLTTENGVKGVNIPVVVIIQNGEAGLVTLKNQG